MAMSVRESSSSSDESVVGESQRWRCTIAASTIVAVVLLPSALAFVMESVTDPGSWQSVLSTNAKGISYSISHDSVDHRVGPNDVIGQPTMRDAESSLLRNETVTPATSSVASPSFPPSLPDSFCNVSTPIVATGNIRVPQRLSPEWEKICFSPSAMPPMTFNWPGRNWCYVRTQDRSCYMHAGETALPNWYWAQTAVAREGFAPWPDQEYLGSYVKADLCDMPQNGLPWTDLTSRDRSEAATWMMENVAIYVLNLPSSVDRWDRMKTRFTELGLKAERIPAVDLRVPDAYERAKADGLVPAHYDYDRALKDARAMFARSEKGGIEKLIDEMGIGTLGTTIAHLRAQRLAHDLAMRAGKDLVLILEDDVWLMDDSLFKLRFILTHEIPCDWEVLALTTRCGFGECVSPHLSRMQINGNEADVRCHNGGSYGMYGMLYRREAMPRINRLLQVVTLNNSKPACLPVDISLASLSDKIAYYAVPGTQTPGILHEMNGGFSVRSAISRQSLSPEDARLDNAVRAKR
eukprot:TRINITY_DN63123_c0_g1_i1.p1 TRINITY_DN63123_c0_g1~~TRINITY_DN63123_c0_g1_i1.p1  ORF type:complete len:584 (+),score=69.95 TRINITY_DN63123_c0_g1_i1:187-1752(+)